MSSDLVIPHSEYPRPQMVRERWQCLNGYWNYTINNNEQIIPDTFEGRILVPYSIETEKSGVGGRLLPDEVLWYSRIFTVPEEWSKQRILLNFEAVDWECLCYVNRKTIGSHKGGYLPFSFDITDYLLPGENEIILSVKDPTDESFNQRGKQSLKPATIFYTATSGIWQTVWIEAVPQTNHIIGYKITADPDRSEIVLSADLAKESEALFEIMLDGRKIQETVCTPDGNGSLAVSAPELWSPSTPVLYSFRLSLKDSSADTVTGYFAFRKIELKEGRSGFKRIFLNGKPLFLHAPLDQGYWPESGMTPPDDDAMIFDIEAVKELGFNSVRKHIKIEPRRWYYHADRLGILVIQDMISGGRHIANSPLTLMALLFGFRINDTGRYSRRRLGRKNSENRHFFKKELGGLITHLYNHPSIVMWVPFNEGWGQFDSQEIGRLTEAADSTRLVDRTSGWFDQGGGGFNSRHTYFIKLKNPRKQDRRAYFISEYGGYNLAVEGRLWNKDKEFGYKTMESSEELTERYTALIREQLIPLISRGLSAAVYTQLSDVEIEINGLYTYDRKVLKIDRNKVQKLNLEIYMELKRCENNE